MSGSLFTRRSGWLSPEGALNLALMVDYNEANKMRNGFTRLLASRWEQIKRWQT